MLARRLACYSVNPQEMNRLLTSKVGLPVSSVHYIYSFSKSGHITAPCVLGGIKNSNDKNEIKDSLKNRFYSRLSDYREANLLSFKNIKAYVGQTF